MRILLDSTLLTHSTILTPPRPQQPVAITLAGTGERWTSEVQARADLERLHAALEGLSWPPVWDAQLREWRERVSLLTIVGLHPLRVRAW